MNNSTRLHRELFAFALLIAISLMATSPATAAIVANFDGGNGTGDPDAYTGQAGNGWASAWSQTGASGSVVTTTPINGGADPYLSVTDTGGSGSHTIRRQFDGVDPNQPHTISWSWRFDGDLSDFASQDDRVHFFADDGNESGSGSGNAWLIGVTANRSGFGAQNGNFYFYDRTVNNGFTTNNMFNTNVALQEDTVYEFTVNVDPTTATYDASISDGVTTVSATGLTFRNGTPGAYDILHFGTNSNAGGDDLTFALDNISITAVPEPSTLVLIGLAGLGLGIRRRRR